MARLEQEVAQQSTTRLITDNLDIWTGAIAHKSGTGRGASKKYSLHGIQRLRELILELAVRGRLVPQDERDNSPHTALVESQDCKDRLIGAGLIKKSRSKKEVKEESFYTYPNNWAVAKIEDLFNVINGRAYKKPEMLSEGTPILRVGNLFTSNEWYYSDLELDADKYIDNGDLIYAWSASFGPFIWDGGKVIFHYHIWKMDIYSENTVDKNFSKLFLTAISERIKASGNGIAMIHMTKERMEKILHPLPPIQEQHRIVDKVDELMRLCDALEAQTIESISAHQTLVETLLDALLIDNPKGDSFADNWQRVLDHFDTLFTTAASIDTLKQTILQLAVMGKLVPQDASDEPASKLLERIAEEKAQLIKDKKIKKQKPLPEITEDEKPFALPVGWEYCQLQDICYKITDGEHSTPQRTSSGHYLLSARNVTNEGIILNDVDFVPTHEFERIRKRCDPNIGDILISCSGSVGRVALVDKNNTYSMVRSAAMIRPCCNNSSPLFLSLILKSPYLQQQIKNKSKQSAQANLFLGAISNLVMVIPPIQEQHRIVAKVDELMSLCDQLKARLQQVQEKQVLLTDAIVTQAL